MHPTIPFEFSPSVEPHGEGHLDIFNEADGARRIKWDVIGAEVVNRKIDVMEESSFKVVEALNPSLRYHDYHGYSLGNFTEFFIHQVPRYAGFSVKCAEITIGEATPLAANLFDPIYYEKYFGPWNTIHSIRIFGLGYDDAELAFANAAMLYYDANEVLPRLLSLDLDFLWDEESEAVDDEAVPRLAISTPLIKDIVPLRFFYSGLSNADDDAACISFYKVIEYYSTQTNFNAFRRVRHDESISDADYIKKVTELVTKDEKGLIYRLVGEVANDEIVEVAFNFNLIPSMSNHELADRLYTFRNSIVHGKHSFGFDLNSTSLIASNLASAHWRLVLAAIARACLRKYGKLAI